MRLDTEQRRENHQVGADCDQMVAIIMSALVSPPRPYKPNTGLALISKIIKRRFQGLIILFTSNNCCNRDKLNIMFGGARQH